MNWDREEDHLATPAEAVAEYARNIGGEYPDRAWLLHDWDVWVANPHYHGPKVRHPEDYDPDDEASEAPGFDDPAKAEEFKTGPAAMDDSPGDDEIPF